MHVTLESFLLRQQMPRLRLCLSYVPELLTKNAKKEKPAAPCNCKHCRYEKRLFWWLSWKAQQKIQQLHFYFQIYVKKKREWNQFPKNTSNKRGEGSDWLTGINVYLERWSIIWAKIFRLRRHFLFMHNDVINHSSETETTAPAQYDSDFHILSVKFLKKPGTMVFHQKTRKKNLVEE